MAFAVVLSCFVLWDIWQNSPRSHVKANANNSLWWVSRCIFQHDALVQFSPLTEASGQHLGNVVCKTSLPSGKINYKKNRRRTVAANLANFTECPSTSSSAALWILGRSREDAWYRDPSAMRQEIEEIAVKKMYTKLPIRRTASGLILERPGRPTDSWVWR